MLPRVTCSVLKRFAMRDVMLAGNVVFSLLAARRIFEHFLRKPQPTFIACYALLSLAGVLISLYPAGTVLLAIVVLKERVTRWQVLGMVAALAAVAMIAVG